MTEGEARRRVAEGAARAGGERAVRRRRTTPLLAGREPVPAPATTPPEPPDAAPAARVRPAEPAPTAPTAPTARTKAPVTPAKAVPVKAPAKAVPTRTPAGAVPAKAPAKAAPAKARAKAVPAKASPAPSTPTKRAPAKVVAAKPVATKPVAPKPVATKPVAPKPVAAKRVPAKVEPVAAKPVAAKVESLPAEPVPADAVPAGVTAAPVGRRPVRRTRVAASRRTPGGERLVAVADAAQRVGEELVARLDRGDVPGVPVGTGSESGPSTEGSLEERLAGVLAFVRRRLTGDFAVDEFGFDPELTDTVLLNLWRPLYRSWFRVEVRGIENIPSSGGALIVANHSGAIALDALMTQVAVHDEHPAHRHLRLLGADLVFSTPLLGELARKGGATLASNADAERLLSGGQLVAVWPEGFKGIGKPFSERYKLQRFGRGGFVSAALKTGTPIVPCAIVGAEETYPIVGNMPSVARLLGLPYAPITPTWPLLGPLGLVPLPSKWLIEFCPPVLFDESSAGSAAADDPMTVFDLTDQVRQTIQQTLYSLLVQRRSVFF